ncbi:MAG TPA: glycine--tRNA ligase subunit beta [Bryobacteraceae bacterium]|nr:glycine--tRNA ligase subunit beta [Bryobacteraceae bacterium]
MTDTLPFLLEIGSEEIPDWMIEPALADLQHNFEKIVDELKLGGRVTRVDATPRRLVLFADGLMSAQADEERTVSGPPVAAGEGAARGFAKKLGVAFEALETTATPKGDYYAVRQKVTGRKTVDVLAEALPTAITGISWPRSMYWTGKSGPRFIRPIRWLVALLGDGIVPFEIAGVRSGAVSRGHRRLGADAVAVHIGNYEAELRKNFVLLSAAERRARIANALGPGVVRDEALIHTLVYLTEFPVPIRGAFDAKYLELPKEILSTVMRHHQRYFSVEFDGQLAPAFVAVMNTSEDPEGLVRRGNERVLRARFNDARFFWDVDQRRPLAARVGDLRNVTFQAKLGSCYDKVQRIVAIVQRSRELATPAAVRAATLCKCDLTTEMVKEFTELQGVVGGLYARAQGEPEAVWRAIYDHYKPASMEDSIPSTREGQIVALADKLDTLIECFRIGLIPSGSKDPFGLRRAAQGIIKIVVEAGLRVPELLDVTDEKLRDFLVDRLRYYFREIRGFPYDEVNATIRWDGDPCDSLRRLEALHAVRRTPDFEPLAASFKRIKNILRQADWNVGESIDESRLEPGPERALYDAYRKVQRAIDGVDYKSSLATIASLRPQVDTFFDKVLVNAPDPEIRRNRLTLLSNLLTEFSEIADFSEIVTS